MMLTLFRDLHVRWALSILLIVASLALGLSHARTVLAYEPGDSLQTCLSSNLDPETGHMPVECGLCSGPLACLGPEPVLAWAALSISAGERLPVPPATTAKPMHGVQPGQRGPPVIS